MNKLLETNTIVSFDNVKEDVRDICRYLNTSHPHVLKTFAAVGTLKDNQRLTNEAIKELIVEIKRIKTLLINLEPQVKVERHVEPIIVERSVPRVIVKRVPHVVIKRVPKVIIKRVIKTKIVHRAPKRKLIASKASTKVHDKRCAFAKNISRKNKFVFESKLNAHARGFKDCACVA